MNPEVIAKEPIYMALAGQYIAQLERLTDRQARLYLALAEKDMFAMSADEAKKYQRRLDEVAKDVESLAALKDCLEQLSVTYANAIAWERYKHRQTLKNLDTICQSVSEDTNIQNQLISIFIECQTH